MKDQDSIFFRNFSMLLGFLVFLTIVLAYTGYYMHDDILGDNTMATDRSGVAKTIESIAQVNTGDVIIAKIEKTSAPVAAFGGSLDGKQIYDNVCSACHNTGAAGAPKLESSAWDGRISQGLVGLTTSAIKGKGAMPPKGGLANLSEAQVAASIVYMTKDFHTFEDAPTFTPKKITSDVISKMEDTIELKKEEVVAKIEQTKAGIDGKKIYDTACFACHATGAAGAPKLEAAVWKERLTGGVEALIASAIKGKGAMPPKGGRTDLSDDDIKAAVEFMIKGF